MPAIAHLYSACTQREFGFHLAAENCAKAGECLVCVGVCVCPCFVSVFQPLAIYGERSISDDDAC